MFYYIICQNIRSLDFLWDVELGGYYEREYLQFNKLLEFQEDLVHAYTLKTHRIGFRRGGRNQYNGKFEKAKSR